MQIDIVFTGKTDNGFIKQGIQEYLKRLKFYSNVQVIELRTLKNIKNLSLEMQKKRESENIQEKLNNKHKIILLDEIGTEYTSKEFSKKISKLEMNGQNVSFVIGGAYGFSDELKNKYERIALSRMTMSHQMIRLFFVEQLYRAYTIIRGENYHH